MTDLTILAGLAVCLLLLATSTALLLLSYKPRAARFSERVQRLLRGPAQAAAAEAQAGTEDNEPLRDRILKPILEAITAAFLRLLPAGVMKTIQERLESAGNPGRLSPLEFIGIQIAFAIAAVFVAILIGDAMTQNGMG